MKDKWVVRRRFKVNLVVETYVMADSAQDAATYVEETVQRVLDTHAKRLSAVVGADYGEVTEIP